MQTLALTLSGTKFEKKHIWIMLSLHTSPSFFEVVDCIGEYPERIVSWWKQMWGTLSFKITIHYCRPNCKTMWWRKFYTFLPLSRGLFLKCLLSSGIFWFIFLLLQGKFLTLSPDSFPDGQFFYNLPLLRCFVA